MKKINSKNIHAEMIKMTLRYDPFIIYKTK